MHTSSHRLIGLDFDGTVANTTPHLFSAAERLSFAHRIDFDRKKLESDARSFGWKHALQECMETEQHDLHAIIRTMCDVVAYGYRSPLIDGMHELIQELHQHSSLHIVIVTLNTAKLTRHILGDEISGLFHGIYGADTHPGLLKAEILTQVQREVSVQGGVYIGDDVTDVDSARKANMQPISVTWGVCNGEVLRKHNNRIASTTEELRMQLQELGIPL